MNAINHQTSCQASFLSTLPRRPYCANILSDGITPKLLHKAIEMEHIQPNRPSTVTWLNFDVDNPGAYYAADDANLAMPNIICENRQNGHAHLFYRLESPVSTSILSRSAPIKFLEAVQRGYTRRLQADVGYCGLISKNPLHPKWRTEWARLEPYSMKELDDYLFFEDKRYNQKVMEAFGLGRNCTLFEFVRKEAYRRFIRSFDPTGLQDYLLELALQFNCQFATPLSPREVRGTVKSVVKWVRRHFSKEGFSRVQSTRGSKPWKRDTLTKLAPWEGEGISRSTWERRRAKAALLSDMDTASSVRQDEAALLSDMDTVQKNSLTVKEGDTTKKPWQSEGVSRATWYRNRAKNKTNKLGDLADLPSTENTEE
jgi:hypothetical protein